MKTHRANLTYLGQIDGLWLQFIEQQGSCKSTVGNMCDLRSKDLQDPYAAYLD